MWRGILDLNVLGTWQTSVAATQPRHPVDDDAPGPVPGVPCPRIHPPRELPCFLRPRAAQRALSAQGGSRVVPAGDFTDV